MKDEKKRVIELLREELPASMLQDVDEIEKLIMQEKYRLAYLKMYEIRKNQIWSPTSEYLHLMEEFWWKYAN